MPLILIVLGLMVLGFLSWWPLGLLVLAFLVARGRFGYWRHSIDAGCGPWRHAMEAGYGPAFDGGDGRDRWERKMGRLQEKMDRVRAGMERVRGSDFFGPASSGNRAFDDYRAETLKRLEDEQREFKDFLARLRVAKDRAEFDQFMADRRQRPSDPNSRTEPPAA